MGGGGGCHSSIFSGFLVMWVSFSKNTQGQQIGSSFSHLHPQQQLKRDWTPWNISNIQSIKISNGNFIPQILDPGITRVSLKWI